MCDSIYQYTKANNKYMEDYDKNKESPYIRHIWIVNVAKAFTKSFWVDRRYMSI